MQKVKHSKPLVFSLTANPDTLWRVRVVVHKTISDLRRARSIGAGDDDVLAFCDCYPISKAMTDPDCVFCAIHLCRHPSTMQLRYIAHECAHAMLRYNFLLRLRLDGASEDIEEHAAATVEHMLASIIYGLNENGIKPL